MKNTIKLLLTLSLPFALASCASKPISSNTPVTPPKTQLPQPTINTTTPTQPSLGRPVSIPQPTQTVTLPQTQPQVVTPRPINIPTPTPTNRPIPKHGESYFSKKFKLPNTIKESSGLIKIDNQLWTMNDSGGKATLYQINERNGAIVKSVSIQNARNTDWEDIAYDDNYVYIGDVGNNKGNRKDLKVYRIPRAALRTQNTARAEAIHFSYSDQKNFTSRAHQHNYDCEAMVAYNGKIYLFSKNWTDKKTRLYELNATPGKHTAKYISTYNIQGLVSGATLNSEMGILLLTTYSSLLDVNVWAFSNYTGGNFLRGNAKRLNLKTPLQGQVEGVTFTGNYQAYLSSEAFTKYIFSFDATLYNLDFSGEFE